MKNSKYNIIVQDQNNDRVFCYNATTHNFFPIQTSKLNSLKSILENPDAYKLILPSFFQKLKEGRFIVRNSDEEINYIRKKNQAAVDSKHYKITIMPTLGCNFNCWYCVQIHKENERMSSDVIDRIKAHINNMVFKKNILSLNIEWFGGEPFLCFEDAIYPINSYAKRICEEKGISFYSSATTNGYLITKAVADKLEEINLTGFQVTLDGNKEFHDKVRFEPNVKTSSFDTILENITYILQSNENSKIAIRINYDDKNFTPEILIEQINRLIPYEIRNKIYFRIRKVWQVKHSEKFRDAILEFKMLAKNNGYSDDKSSDIIDNFIRCYACQKYYSTIAPNGSIYKCTARENYSEKPLGIIQKSGIIKWVVPDFTKRYYGKALFENNKCLKCNYLPMCMGPCPKSFEENNMERTDFKCYKSRPLDLKYEDSILQYCLNHENDKI